MAGKLVPLFVLGLLVACSVPMQLPSEFLVLHGRSRAGDFAAVTGDDARLWMRQFVEPSGGDLTFWSQILRKDFEDRGYRLVADGDCVDAAGVTGAGSKPRSISTASSAGTSARSGLPTVRGGNPGSR